VERRGVYRVLVGKPEGKRHLEDPGVDGKIILMCFQEVGCGVVEWLELAQDRGRWLALVTAVKNLRVP
jgi:hypothetical protein